MEFSAKQIASLLQGEIVGDENATVHTFAKIEEGVPGAISFLSNPKYTHYIYNTKSSIVLVNKDFKPEKEIAATLIKVENAYDSLAQLLAVYEANKPKKKGIDSTASISESAKIGKEVYIAPYVVIGDNAIIGDNVMIYPHTYIGDNSKIEDNTIIYSNTSIYHDCKIGANCIIHSGAIIGADGFGFAPTSEGYKKIPQIGIVIIEDDVEIGANTCIDRATMGATIIRKGAKLDNLIQVAHNDEVGSHTVIAAQAGIAGSTKIGQWCMIGGQAGLTGHAQIGDRVSIAAQAGIPNNVKSGEQIMGSPAFDIRKYYKSAALFRKLPDIYSDLNALRRELNELKDKFK